MKKLNDSMFKLIELFVRLFNENSIFKIQIQEKYYSLSEALLWSAIVYVNAKI
jgi:hypothetical protein